MVSEVLHVEVGAGSTALEERAVYCLAGRIASEAGADS